MSFDSARGTIAWQQDALEINEKRGNWARDLAQEELENLRKIRNSLLAYRKRKAGSRCRAIRNRTGLSPDYVYKSSFFTIEWRARPRASRAAGEGDRTERHGRTAAPAPRYAEWSPSHCQQQSRAWERAVHVHVQAFDTVVLAGFAPVHGE
jgi:hypothetical protein